MLPRLSQGFRFYGFGHVAPRLDPGALRCRILGRVCNVTKPIGRISDHAAYACAQATLGDERSESSSCGAYP